MDRQHQNKRMSSPIMHQGSECHHCKRQFDDCAGLESLLGTCTHHVCVKCIGTIDAERRSFNVAIGPYIPCPIRGCDHGRFVHQFDVPLEVVSSSHATVDVVSSAAALDLEISSPVKVKSDPNNCYEPQTSSADDATSSSAILVTPIPMKIKSEEISSGNPLNIKSGDFDSDADEYSRFSEGFTSDNGVNPKKEETDEDEGSRFSDDELEYPSSASNNIINNPKKEETDEEKETWNYSDDDEGSRFSDVSGFRNEGSDFEMEVSIDMKKDGIQTNAPEVEEGETVVKEEPTYAEIAKRQAKNSRQYGDRVLLARQSKLGMMKLGGGNQGTYMWPKNPKERLARMGGRYCMAYNSSWSP